MRVLVTGHRGYIGSVLTGVLRHARMDVVGLDLDWYEDCDFGRVHDETPSFAMDVRDVSDADMLSFDAVVHLASLPEGLDGAVDSRLFDEINVAATAHLAECCRRANVGRFLFASSCAVYGRSGVTLMSEEDEARPATPYAWSKLQAEQAILPLVADGFAPTCLRFPTVFGVSPRLRLDVVVNDFVAAAVANHRIDMRTRGDGWRPFVHVEDLCRAVSAFLLAPESLVRGEAFNVAPRDSNHRVIDVADAVVDEFPDVPRKPAADIADERSYSVSSEKFHRAFPQFEFRWSLSQGVRQLRAAMQGAGLTAGDRRSHRYRRAERLRNLLETAQLGDTLAKTEKQFV